MSHDINRYLEIMRRTGLPVIVATGKGEPVVVMPLDAYETLLGPSLPAEPAYVPTDTPVPPPNPANFPAYDPMEEQTAFPPQSQENQKIQAKSRKLASSSQSAEDRFFLEPLE